MIKDIKEMKNLQDKMKDVLRHPDNDLAYIKKLRDEFNFSDIEMQDLKSAFGKIISTPDITEVQKLDYINNSWKNLYEIKPPKIREFLTPKWLGATAEEGAIFEYIKDIMETLFSETNRKSNLITYLPIGVGKSFLAMLILLYTSVHFNYLRNPRKLFNVNASTYIIIALIAFSRDKAFEIYGKPLLNMLANAPMFERCAREDQLLKRVQESKGSGQLFYSTAISGAIFRINDLSFKQISDLGSVLGLNILSASLTELGFFMEKGWTDEDVLRLYNDVKGRIYSRFPDNYFAKTILDSSPNTLESSIDRFILQEAHKDPMNYLVTGTKWEYQPWLFQKWQRTGKTFPVFVGTASRPAKIIEGGKESIEYKNYDSMEIVEAPIDILQLCRNDLGKTIKDYFGLPSASADKLVNPEHIERIFSPALKNIYTYITAPATLPPESLIWDKIKDDFFYKIKGDRYEFYRHPKAPRYISIDQSYATDFTGIGVSHVEMNKKGELVHVTDMAITIVPTKDKINLEAIKFFVRDLRKYGGMPIAKVSFDQFQSQSTIQYLERYSFDVIKLSVDSSTEPYLNYIGLMSRNCVKMGRSLIMKNNLKSLIMSKTPKSNKPKVDHVNGDMSSDLTDTEWGSSKLGYYGKDLSDAVVASVYLADTYGSKSPSLIWEDVESNEESLLKVKEKLQEDVFTKFKLKRGVLDNKLKR